MTNAILISLAAVLIFWVVSRFSVWGFRLKSVRESEMAAAVAGIRVEQVRFWVFVAGGGAAGLAGAAMVLGDAGRFRMDMSDGFGLMGIPVALLGKGKPLGVLLSALLFAALHHGATALDLEATHVNRDLAEVIQALVVIVVVAERLFTAGYWRQTGRKGAR